MTDPGVGDPPPGAPAALPAEASAAEPLAGTKCATPAVAVALDLPLDRLFDYALPPGVDHAAALVGRRVVVPFGSGRRVGIVVGPAAGTPRPLKPIESVIADGLPALPPAWFALCEFAAGYYQAPLGQVMLQSLPQRLRRCAPPKTRMPRRSAGERPQAPPPPVLNDGQAAAVAAVSAALGRFQPFLLYGITGSGKTEVYLRLVEAVLAQGRQVLLMVPEINLTPQLEARVAARFPEAPLAALHSELTEAARLTAWRAAFTGQARIVLGTRLSVFAPLPELGLVIVDEEHDASYKQQDGVRYSARDLAIVRASQAGVPVLLGSATPSLESWANAQGGRFVRLTLAARAVPEARLPAIRIVDTRREKLVDGLSAALAAAIEARLQRGEQSLVFLNRRGYAPVLACPACGWIAPCRRCAANLVVHLADRRLRCHHCGLETEIPGAARCAATPTSTPSAAARSGSRRRWRGAFPGARILRVDRDAARSRQQWEAVARRIHGGEADLIVGTQMLAKGHDFPRLTLVGVVGADAALFAADWRAPERLFAQLMQVGGRAGRADLAGEVLIQTEHPEHPLYRALADHDYAEFAAAELAKREQAGFPPYSHQAVLRADAGRLADALAFLATAAALADLAAQPAITVYDPVPMKMARLAARERGQLLVESFSRPALQAFLAAWRPRLATIRARAGLRWHLEVDPYEV